VKPSRTALNARKKPTRLLPTSASSIGVSQVPPRSLHRSPNRLNSASIQDLTGLHRSHRNSKNPYKLIPLNKNIALQDHFHLDHKL
jgi:hypothetical protein